MIKDTKKLFASSKARQEHRAFVLEGARLCFDVLHSVYEVQWLLLTQEVLERYPDRTAQLINRSEAAYLITDEVAQKLSQTETAQGIFAVCRMQEQATALTGDKLLALDMVSDPSNIGAILRTAEALGINGILAYRCCDIYNPKALRAAMGSSLRIPVKICADLESELLSLKNTYRVYATVAESAATPITAIDFSQPAVCVIGNEANGVEENIRTLADDCITIPMLGRAESLNAGVAAAITMWEMLR